MKYFIDITLTAREPLVITDGSAESMANATLPYIPGNMLLGALASRWASLNKGLDPDGTPEFQDLFLKDEVWYGCAWPLCGEAAATPIPTSYLHRKNCPDLPAASADEDDGKKEYYVRNSLIRKDDDKPEDGGSKPKLKRVRAGFMHPEELWKPAERQTWNIHVALGRERSHREGLLFGFSALAAGSRFRSRVICASGELANILHTLLAKTERFNVGHSRSAGYGLVRVEASAPAAVTTAKKKAKIFTVYLRSPYIPAPSWENPIECLARELGGRLSSPLASFREIQGYNSFWKKPRTSRTAINMGGVFRLDFDEERELETPLYLGGDRDEGYGVIELDPPFLREAEPTIKIPDRPAAKPRKNLPPYPLLNLLRERAMEREARNLTEQWLREWRGFIDGDGPSASQRSRLRTMDADEFEELLTKSQGAQWSRSVAPSPFKEKAARDFVENIVRDLLNREKFLKTHEIKAPELPGGPASDKELEKLAAKAHKLFVSRLAAAWSKAERNANARS
ncbi:MAG: hypothetical protein K2H64_05820 [Desulfovibrio sp.]|nr:hypothetical protein [Desulfovibrio sp.]